VIPRSELNPIELVWHALKVNISAHLTGKMVASREVLPRIGDFLKPETTQHCLDHVARYFFLLMCVFGKGGEDGVGW
jgi:hypothetical protein